ncbi:MAG: sugar phosphate isomerase/epimerase [Trueperaceae bacterium]|nr:sugar phosphate isomerase/epimerase [Trueperaceae bacterium]
MKTRTGQFPIGFRRMGYDWHKDLDALIAWTKDKGLELIDLGRDGDSAAKTVIDAGLKVGSVDFPEWQGMISADKAKRADAIAKNADYVKTCAAAGATNFFLVMLPEDPAKTRKENFGYMVESFAELAPTLESVGGHVVIEGWPGPGALCCTPEGYRGFFEQCPSKAMGVNYDPSHLLRMGIDPIRFLTEFIDRVFHVHGKDCTVINENVYEYGTEQPATFADPIPWGGMHWRYTIPGHGLSRWPKILKMLEEHGYKGGVSIELEDVKYSGSQANEELGILQGARFLAGT